MKGRYVFPNVRNAMERRYDAMVRSGTLWTAGMIASIRKTGDAYFRWHDSGDVQGYNHLHNIMVVANHTPNVKHWLPTREYALIREWVRNGKDIPENLVIRVSVPMIGGMDGAKEWDNFSTVDVPSLPENVKMDVSRVDCPAYTQGGKCGSCRSCWDRSVNMINYPLH